jgi:hypothetical protein
MGLHCRKFASKRTHDPKLRAGATPDISIYSEKKAVFRAQKACNIVLLGLFGGVLGRISA